MYSFPTLWMLSMILTGVIAYNKNLNVASYVFMSAFIGPLAILIVFVVSSKESSLSGSSGSSGNSLNDLKGQLAQVKNTLLSVQKKVTALEEAIFRISGQQEQVDQEKEVVQEEVLEVSIQDGGQEVPSLKKEAVEKQKISAELNFGKNWLNKIGIVVFTLGIGFLISYTFKHFGPFMKIAFGYLVTGAFFFFGLKLEKKEDMKNYGRVLLGGAWALTYFTTYAMYHFDGSRIINSQLVDLYLLALVAVGMIKHALKYKSEEMVSVALFIAYFTSTLGHITTFTFVSCLLLSVVILFLVYKFQWTKILILGVVLTFGVHYYWISPNMTQNAFGRVVYSQSASQYYDLMNFWFLTAYWLVFFLGIHIIRAVKDISKNNMLASISFGNFAIYGIFIYPLIMNLFHAHRFSLVLGFGVIYLVAALLMKRLKREEMYISDIVVAVMGITFAIPLKFSNQTTLLLWLIEIPFLLSIGIYFKQKVLRYLSYALSVVAAVDVLFFETLYHRRDFMEFFRLKFSWREFLLLCGSVSMGVCSYAHQRGKEMFDVQSTDERFDLIHSFLSCVFLCSFMYSWIPHQWLALSFAILGFIFFIAGDLLRLRRLQVYSYIIFMFIFFDLIVNRVTLSPPVLKSFVICIEVLIFFAVYLHRKYVCKDQEIVTSRKNELQILHWAAVLMLVSAIFKYISWQWISLGLGGAGVVLISLGILSQDKLFRMGGLLVIAITLGRVIFVDMSQLDVIFKIISFIVLGGLFLGISYVYNRYNIGQETKEP